MVTTCVVMATTEGLTLATTSAIEGNTNASPLGDGGDQPESAGVVLAGGRGPGDGDGGAGCGGGDVSISGSIVHPAPNIRERARTSEIIRFFGLTLFIIIFNFNMLKKMVTIKRVTRIEVV